MSIFLVHDFCGEKIAKYTGETIFSPESRLMGKDWTLRDGEHPIPGAIIWCPVCKRSTGSAFHVVIDPEDWRF